MCPPEGRVLICPYCAFMIFFSSLFTYLSKLGLAIVKQRTRQLDRTEACGTVWAQYGRGTELNATMSREQLAYAEYCPALDLFFIKALPLILFLDSWASKL